MQCSECGADISHQAVVRGRRDALTQRDTALSRIAAINEQLAHSDALALEQARRIAGLEALLREALDGWEGQCDLLPSDRIDEIRTTARIAESKKEKP